MNYILDTNIISELISIQPNQKVIGWLKAVDVLHQVSSSFVLNVGQPAIRDIEEIAINLYHTLV
ncbi:MULTISPECIES: hypothetical protein [unclassified Tolypothrix]|uniref:hypothetical protein n=1 Tax=unclassified Tolypothrix TaxID=2649714 RepID=UPI0005EAC323|nr:MULTISPECIES: hypothetical protein [unclassified Tolypothrix]EKF04442.1 toxin-antitoxin system, toxin component, PIN domain protein [Tolypothrix sp. PCC 7601]UYD32898.1 hypothetical protein HG267_28505 [Tolypothrix sp. PCC 7601]BAY90729.1 hypothetical protein NIES3275_27460 [Microchaete diplosiphon NIES-3275]